MFLSVMSLLMLLLKDKLMFYWSFMMTLISIMVYNNMMYYYFYSMDTLSFYMILMSLWIYFLSTEYNMKFMNKITFMLMSFLTLQSFVTTNILLFYITFEIIFLMMFIFLVNNSNSMERIQASFFMFFYTMVFSLPFLLMILLYLYTNSNKFLLYTLITFYNMKMSTYLWVFMIAIFMVKLPLFTFHLWLPKAHVEATLKGSMILAGVLLKIGGYGLLRFYPILMIKSIYNSIYFCLLLTTSMLGGVLMTFICLRQTDLKKIIAYSSIVHMNFMLICLFTNTNLMEIGIILMMMSHGFISPLMFYLMNQFYVLTHSRSLIKIKAGLMMSPMLVMYWLISCILNFGFPPFMSFLSEIIIIISAFSMTWYEFIMILLFPMMSGLYSIYMFNSLYQNNTMKMMKMENKLKTSLDSFLMMVLVLLFPLLNF